MNTEPATPPTPPQPLPHAPLHGIKVVDLTRVMTGPYCTMMLGDLGADIIKIEQPGKGDDTRHWGPPFIQGEASYFLTANRNKRSIAIDLKSEGGKTVLWNLLEQADVLVENFSPGTMDRLGFGYDTVHAKHPSLIYASISGFGQTGPSRSRTAYDLVVQGMSGMMSVTGPEGGTPTKLGVPVADIAAGMFSAYAIAGALFGRERDPERLGSWVDTSMYGGQIAMLTYQAGVYLTTGEVPTMSGNRHSIITPYDTFPTSDGYVTIAVGNDVIWDRFCTALRMDDERTDPRFRTNADRSAHRPELYERINARLAAFTTDELVPLLDAAAVPCGPIAQLDEVFNDPQVADQDLRRTVQHATLGDLDLAGAPYHFDGAPPDFRHAPPVLGQHTREILMEYGFSVAEVDGLLAEGAVAEPEQQGA